MSDIFKVITCLCFLLSLSVISQAKDWRGLTPLLSTREDVERLLGEPPPPPKDGSRVYTLNKGRSIYFLDEGEVYIVFAQEDFPAAADCPPPVADGSVLMITVTPKKQITLSDLQLDEKKLRKYDPTEPPDLGYMVYIDEEEGQLINTYKGRVEEIAYIAASRDRYLCPSYYEKFERIFHMYVDFAPPSRKFDEYSDLSFKEEKAHLDVLAVQLRQEPGAQAYIIVYAGRRSPIGEAIRRGNRAKSYLEKSKKTDPERITVVDGGDRENVSVELWVAPTGAQAPAPTPTIQPSDSRIIDDGRHKSRRRANC